MNALSKKIICAALSLGFMLVGNLSLAAPSTPQKYCQSLAAVSCEILNVEIGGCGTSNYCNGIIKYCRNQQMRIAIFTITAINTPDTTMYVRDSTNNTSRSITGGSTSGSSFSHADLCTYVP